MKPKCSIEQFSAYIEVLQKHFSATWLREMWETKKQNVVVPYLFLEHSTRALDFLASLGHILQSLSHATGLNQKLNDLRGEKSHSAYFEIETASVFSEAGHSVSFPKEGGEKSPDIVVHFDDVSFAVECKRLQNEKWEEWESQLMRRVANMEMTLNRPEEVTVNIELNQMLTHILMEKETDLNSAFLEAIGGTILRELELALSESNRPTERNAGEFATIKVATKVAGTYSGTSGMGRHSPALFRRIFQNGVLRACAQLPTDGPGVAVIYAKQLPNAHFFRTLFGSACSAQPERFGHVAAVLLCPMQTMFQKQQPHLHLNPSCRFSNDAHNGVQLLRTGFGALHI